MPDDPVDPELTRSAFPELTRCDACGELIGSTLATLAFANDPGDGWHWLHPECQAGFKPVRSVPVRAKRFLGAVLEEPDGSCSAYRYHTRAEGLFVGNEATPNEAANLLFAPQYSVASAEIGWLRSRFCRS